MQTTDRTWLKKDSSGTFSIKDASRVVEVDIVNYTTTVAKNGEVVKALPSTTRKEGFVARSGTKLILKRHDSLKMNSDTVVISSGSSETYNLDVQYTTRVTQTGESTHAAPWSVDSQGKVSVSHGCVRLSIDNAGWFYKGTSVGDIAEFTGSDRKMRPSEGMGV